jgi:Tol biopolymer transport system component
VNVFNSASLVGYDPFFTGSQLYFTGDAHDGHGVQIWVADYDKQSDIFGTPTLVNLGGDGDNDTPWVSRDGKQLLFESTRSDGYGGYDLYSATWDGSGWSNVTNMGPNVNTSANEYTGRIAEDAGLLMFDRGFEKMQAPVAAVPEPTPLIIWSLLGTFAIVAGWRRWRIFC